MNDRLKIETPCHEDWTKMSPNKEGRHCGLCDKTVVDFTVMSQEEIANYLTHNSKAQICGRILVPREKEAAIQIKLKRLYKNIEDKIRFKPLRISLLGSLSLIMLISGCTENHTADDVNKQQVRRITHTDTLIGEPIAPKIQKETNPIRETTLGNIAQPDFHKSSNQTIHHTTPPEAVPIVGKVIYQQELMGEVKPLDSNKEETNTQFKKDSLN
jgi:hypothetical protein